MKCRDDTGLVEIAHLRSLTAGPLETAREFADRRIPDCWARVRPFYSLACRRGHRRLARLKVATTRNDASMRTQSRLARVKVATTLTDAQNRDTSASG